MKNLTTLQTWEVHNSFTHHSAVYMQMNNLLTQDMWNLMEGSEKCLVKSKSEIVSHWEGNERQNVNLDMKRVHISNSGFTDGLSLWTITQQTVYTLSTHHYLIIARDWRALVLWGTSFLQTQLANWKTVRYSHSHVFRFELFLTVRRLSLLSGNWYQTFQE